MNTEEQAADAVAEEPTLHDELAAAFETPAEEQPAPEAEAQPDAAAQEPEGPNRDEQGRFAKKEDVSTEQPQAEPQEGEPAAQEQASTHLTGETPPPGWSVAAKGEWANLSPAVREAIAKREQEVDVGFQKYAGLGPYQQMAEQHGTTLAQSLEAYTAAERFLSQDPVNAIKWLMDSNGVSLQQLAGATQDAAQGENGAQVDPTVQQLQQTVSGLQSELNGFKQSTEQQRMNDAQSAIDAFAADPANIYFENVRSQMGRLMQSGAAQDLKSAYEQACWANPEIREKLVLDQINASNAEKAKNAQQAATQAERAAKSVSGDPNGAVPAGQASHGNLRDQISAAYDDSSGVV